MSSRTDRDAFEAWVREYMTTTEPMASSMSHDMTRMAGWLRRDLTHTDQYEAPWTNAAMAGWQAARARNAPAWVPVTERLPPAGDAVAVLCDDGAVLTAWASYTYGCGGPVDFSHWVFPHDDDGDSVVTHWMPLPPLPEPPRA